MEQTKIHQDELTGKIEESFNQVIRQRAEALEKLRSLQDNKGKLLIREKERLTPKYGSDHPRVQKISNRMAYNKEFIKALDMEIDRTKIQVPEVASTSWMIHGRVLNEQYKGIPNLKVALYDENGKWIRKMNYACTSLQGYFSIIYPAKGATSEIPALQKLFLTVVDKDKKIIYRETEPLYVKIGAVDYRVIIISSMNESCTSPELVPEPVPNGEDPKLPPDAWIVRGIVTDEKKNGIEGLTISLYDRDLLFDDVLGTTLTDEKGNFKIFYRTDAFKKFFEKKPDIYLKILDNTGKILYTSTKEVRPEAGHEEYFTIEI